MEIKPIAHIYTGFSEKFGLPRQSGRVKELLGQIVFEKPYGDKDAFRGIEEFSHLWIIFGFSDAKKEGISLTVRPPRLGGNKHVGVFASRSPYRPNGLGLSCVKLEKAEHTEKDGMVLLVSGVDMLNGTPIYDIKPYLPYCDAVCDAKGGYGERMKEYRLEVEFDENLLKEIPKEKQKAIIGCLCEDPRPSYHNDDRKYSMKFENFDIHFVVNGTKLKVLSIDKIDENK